MVNEWNVKYRKTLNYDFYQNKYFKNSMSKVLSGEKQLLCAGFSWYVNMVKNQLITMRQQLTAGSVRSQMFSGSSF